MMRNVSSLHHSSLPVDRKKNDRRGDASKANEGIADIEMEEEKRSLIHREIDKFRDTYKVRKFYNQTQECAFAMASIDYDFSMPICSAYCFVCDQKFGCALLDSFLKHYQAYCNMFDGTRSIAAIS